VDGAWGRKPSFQLFRQLRVAPGAVSRHNRSTERPDIFRVADRSELEEGVHLFVPGAARSEISRNPANREC